MVVRKISLLHLPANVLELDGTFASVVVIVEMVVEVVVVVVVVFVVSEEQGNL